MAEWQIWTTDGDNNNPYKVDCVGIVESNGNVWTTDGDNNNPYKVDCIGIVDDNDKVWTTDGDNNNPYVVDCVGILEGTGAPFSYKVGGAAMSLILRKF